MMIRSSNNKVLTPVVVTMTTITLLLALASMVNAQGGTLGMKNLETRLVRACPPVPTTTACLPWTTWYPTASSSESNHIDIPCNTCVKMDITDGSVVKLTKGLNVIGKMEFPSMVNTTMEVPYIVVQGDLIVASSGATQISPQNQNLRIKFTGPSSSDEYYFQPYGTENLNKCIGGSGSNMCNLGKKGLIVAGGSIDIDGYVGDTCPTWTHVYDFGLSDTQTLSNFTGILPSDDKYFQPRPIIGEDCTDPMFDLREDFTKAIGSPGVMLETTSAVNPHDGNYLHIKNRLKSFQGIMLDLKTECLVANIPYLFSVKARLTSTTSTPSLCSQSKVGADGTNHCLRLLLNKRTASLNYPTFRTLLLDSVGASSVPDGQWFTFEGSIVFSPDDLKDDEVIYSALHVMGPEGGINLSLDDIKFTLPSSSSFPVTKQDVCQELMVNGNASKEGSNTFPFYPSQTYGLQLSVKQSYGSSRTDAPSSPEDVINPYFSLKGRSKSFSSPMVKLNKGCMQRSSIYKITNEIRVRNTSTPITASLVLKKTLPVDPTSIAPPDYFLQVLGDCLPSKNEWTTCEAFLKIESEHLMYDTFELFWDFQTDTTSIVDIDAVSVKFMGGGATSSILVDSSEVASCWGVGSEVLVTSHTLEYKDVTVTQIASVESVAEGKTKLTFTTPIPKVTTQLMSQEYATEIALLSRNVVMEAPILSSEEDVPVLDRGGHLSVVYSTGSSVKIKGVDLKGFGQAGKRGKYPIGIFNSELVSGSLINQNTIRGSFQRCIVLDGVVSSGSTTSVTVSNNVAYNTQGHCYVIDGTSSNHVFEKNLGAVTKNLPSNRLVYINGVIGQTDDQASTFWTSTLSQNKWRNNVAAGSERYGFQFQLASSGVTGSGGEFSNNVMHSNARHGLTTYPNGWPATSDKFVLEGIKSFKNVEDGILLQNTVNVTISNALLSDNRIGLEMEKGCQDIYVTNTSIIGLSDTYQSQLDETSTLRSHCPAARPLVGFQFHSETRSISDKTSQGFSFDSITFSKFDPISSGCVGSTAIDLDSQNVYNQNYVSALSSFTSISYDTDATADTKLNLCDATQDVSQIKGVVLKDVDGSHSATPGYIVSSDVATALPSGTTCTTNAKGCYSYCSVGCLRILMIAFSIDESYKDLEIHVSDTTSSYTNILQSFALNTTQSTLLKGDGNHFHQRRFAKAVLPSTGNFTVEFKVPGSSSDSITWPQFVEYIFLKDSDDACTASKPTVTFVKPVVTNMETCAELAVNGGAEGTSPLAGWYHTASSANASVSTFDKISPGLGKTGTNAVVLKNRQSVMGGIGQYLNSNCFVVGETYKVEAIFGLLKRNTLDYVPCDPSLKTSDLNSTLPGISGNVCPRVSLQIKSADGVSYAYPVATAVGQKDSIKNYLYGGFKFDDVMANAQSIFLFIERVSIQRDLVVDDLTIVKHEDTCASPILNGNFDTFGDSRGWFSFGSGTGFEVVSPGSTGAPNTFALKTTRRDSSSSSPAQDVNQECIVEGDAFTVSASVKLMQADGVTPYECIPASKCPDLVMISQSEGTTESEVIASVSGTFTPGAWNQYYGSGRWKASHLTADRLFIMFSQFTPGIVLYVDDIQFASKDNWNCTETASTTGLVRNHDLSTGDGRYWTGYGGASVTTVISDVSTNNTSLKSFNRMSTKSGVGQMLDDGCLNVSDLYMVTAKVKLLNSTSSNIVGCNPLSTSDNDRCPYVAIASQSFGSPTFVKPIATLWAGHNATEISATSWTTSGWNTLKGYFQVMQSELNANLKMIIVAGAPAGIDILVDDVSFLKVSLQDLGVPLPINGTASA